MAPMPAALVPTRTSRRILAIHAAAMLLLAAAPAQAAYMIPLIARIHFNASEFQSVLVTASLPTFLVASIFWAQYLRRVSTRRFLIVHWLFAYAPLALAASSQNVWHLLCWQVIAAAGASGLTPFSGTLLKRLYPDAVRGRVYGLLTMATLVGGGTSVYVTGAWLDRDSNAFRVFLPALAAVEAVGVALLFLLDRKTAIATHRPRRAPHVRAVFAPVTRMHKVLRADRAFLLYEAAFMTYGAGFHICEGLFPVLVTTGLLLEYRDVAQSAHVVRQLATLLMILPAGWLIDRLGAARTSVYAFTVLALYPLGLLLALQSSFAPGLHGVTGLTLASTFQGLALAGVFQSWMMGPVSLAPTPEKVPQYVAIHTALVGIRGVLAQGLGIALYLLAGSFQLPLLLAAGCLVWAAWQMRRIARRFPAASVRSAESRR